MPRQRKISVDAMNAPLGCTTYNFNFLETVSTQLVQTLEELDLASLTEGSLQELGSFQHESKSKQGVYLLSFRGEPAYLGKANDVAARLRIHRRKLLGRQGISEQELGYKALLLDGSMSTAANEELLIAIFRRRHSGMWNGQGFGSKDPGRNRDRTQPGPFDEAHPIRKDYVVEIEGTEKTIGGVFKQLKKQLPYLFRYQKLPSSVTNIQMSLRPGTYAAEAVVRSALGKFPKNWHAAILSYGIVVYKGLDRYWHTTEVVPSPNSSRLPPPIYDTAHRATDPKRKGYRVRDSESE